MRRLAAVARRVATPAVALVLVLATYGAAREPQRSAAERRALAERFAFARFELPDPSSPSATPRGIRPVSPSLDHIAAWISSVGAGVALADLDGDGLSNDLCYVDPRSDRVIVAPAPDTLAHARRYGAFALEQHASLYDSATMAPMGCLPGDVNEDGLADLVVYYWGRTPVGYLRRSGDPVLHTDAYTPEELVPGSERWYTNAATFADVDGDGHPDLIVGNYFQDGARILDPHATGTEEMQHSMSRALNAGRNRLLLRIADTAGSRGSPTWYRDIPDAFESDVAHGWTLAIGAADLDGDLLPELYLANDFGRDRLLHNRSSPGRPRFVRLEGTKTLRTPSSKVLGRDSFKGMGVDFGDLNGDGLLDMVVSNIAAEYALEESHFAFVNTGAPELMRRGIAPFVDRSESLRLSRSDWAWDVKLADFDNDGVPEVVQTTGFVQGSRNRWPELQELATGNDELLRHPAAWPRLREGDDLAGHTRNPFFVRAPDGRYVDLAADLELGESAVSRGIAVADVDGDGDLDFAVANQWGASTFYRNDCDDCGQFVGVRLLLPLRAGEVPRTVVHPGRPGNAVAGRPAVGATAIVRRLDGTVLGAQVDGGNGHSGKRAPELLFGLGKAHHESVEVEVRWRDSGGVVRSEVHVLHPGWHTLLLGWPSTPAR